MARRALVLMSCMLAVACTTSVAPTPTPPTRTTPPTLTTTPPATPLATIQPTASLVPDADAEEVVLRMTEGGGLRYPGATVEEPPRFTLYGDGRVIYTTPAADAPEGTYRLDMWQAQLSSEQAGALVAFALDEGGLGAARESYEYDGIADAGTTWFDMLIDGVSRSVAVYALGYVDEDVPDLEMRARFQSLAQQLTTFETQVRSGKVDSLGEFRPEAWLVTLDEPFGPLDEGPAVAWPWDDLQPADFQPMGEGFAQAILSSDQVKMLADPVNSAQDSLVLEDADGRRYLVRVRPLLPDQIP